MAAVDNLVKTGLAASEAEVFGLLTALFPYPTWNEERIRRMKLLAGPDGYTIYKILEAKHETS